MPQPPHILLVANRAQATARLAAAVRARAARGPAVFHLVVPVQPPGLHRLVDPQEGDGGVAEALLDAALPELSAAAGAPVTGHVGDAEPLMAIQDALSMADYDEIVISTAPRHLAHWLRLDLVSKARGLGLPVTHVEAEDARPPTASASR